MGIALLALRIAWVALGLSILLGALSLRGEVSIATELVKLSVAKAKEQSEKGEAWTEPSFADKPAIYRWSEFLFYSSLLVAVVAFVSCSPEFCGSCGLLFFGSDFFCAAKIDDDFVFRNAVFIDREAGGDEARGVRS